MISIVFRKIVLLFRGLARCRPRRPVRCRLGFLEFEPRVTPNGDALYVWNAPADLTATARLDSFANQEGIKKILINNFPQANDSVLAPNIGYLTANGFSTYALYTDTTRINDFLAYQNRVNAEYRFAGLWLDVEGPWPGGQNEPTTAADLAIYVGAVQVAGSFPVYVSISHHWTEQIAFNNQTKPAYQHIIDIVSGIDVQTAQDRAAVIVSISQDEVAYAQANSKEWFVTIETSDVAHLGMQPFNTFNDDGEARMRQELSFVQYQNVDESRFAFHYYLHAFGSEEPGWDTTPPTAGVVNDGSAADISVQGSTAVIEANWTGFSDGGGIANYLWAIGTSPGGTDVQAFTNVGNATDASASNLSLTAGITYYSSVKAVDIAGNESSPISSNGVTVVDAMARNDVYIVPKKGERLSVDATEGVLANDRAAVSAVLVSKPKRGTLIFHADGSFDYIPGPAYKGFDSFQYRVTDATGALSDVATVQLLPPIAFKVVRSNGLESVKSVKIAIRIPYASSRPVRVNFAAATGGTATPNTDFVLPAGTVSIPPGKTSAEITLRIINDRLREPFESIQIALSSPTNGVLGSRRVHRRIIIDDDTPRITLRARGNGRAARTEVSGTVSGISAPARYFVRLVAITDAEYVQPYSNSRHFLDPKTLTWKTWSRTFSSLRADLIDTLTHRVVASAAFVPR